MYPARVPCSFADEPEHLALLRETVRRFVEREMPREQVRRWDREHRFPPELFRKLARIELRHAEQVLEDMGWTEPPAPPSTGYRWNGPEGPETADVGALHYLMQPYHALELALYNERRAHRFFNLLAKSAPTDKLRRAALAMAAEEAEHVRLIEDWMKRVPPPEPHWDYDPDPPRYVD